MPDMLRALKYILIFLILLVGVGALGRHALQPPPPLAIPEPGFTLESVVLVVPGKFHSKPVNIAVEGSRITRIEAAPPGPTQGYVLPGLVDAHMHGPPLPMPGERALFAFLHLYHGVTLARMAAGDALMRDEIRAGLYPGPKIYTCGPFFDGDPPLWPTSVVLTQPEQAAAAVDKLVDDGFDCVKVYNELTPEVSTAIRAQADKRGLPVIGHVPWRSDFTETIIEDVQHFYGYAPWEPGLSSNPGMAALTNLANMSDERLALLAETAKENNISLTPTLVTFQRKSALADNAALRIAARADLMPEYYARYLWDPVKGLVSSRLLPDEVEVQLAPLVQPVGEMVHALYEAGVEIHTGTDAPAEFIVPGYGLREEFQLLNASGFSAEEVLEISTMTTRSYLGVFGRPPLALGAVADFVVYADDPTQDLAHLDTRLAVVKSGQYYSAEELEAQLERYQDWYASPLYRFFSNGVAAAFLWVIGMLVNT